MREQIQRPCGWLRGTGETGAGKAVPRALASPERGAEWGVHVCVLPTSSLVAQTPCCVDAGPSGLLSGWAVSSWPSGTPGARHRRALGRPLMKEHPEHQLGLWNERGPLTFNPIVPQCPPRLSELGSPTHLAQGIQTKQEGGGSAPGGEWGLP